MRTLHKALAFVIRGEGHGRELLIFRHPSAGVQIPKGTLDPGETPEVAVLRELEEESGVTQVMIAQRLEPLVLPGNDEDKDLHFPPAGTQHIWHVFHLTPTISLPERWTHAAVGSVEEKDLIFSFFWFELDRCRSILHPVFHRALDPLLEALN